MTSPTQPLTEAGRRYFAGTASDMTFRYGPGWTLLDVIRDIEDEAATLEARGMQMLLGLSDPKVPWKTVTTAAEMVRRTLILEYRLSVMQKMKELPRVVCDGEVAMEPPAFKGTGGWVSVSDVAQILRETEPIR